jgi:hypothetical protein
LPPELLLLVSQKLDQNIIRNKSGTVPPISMLEQAVALSIEDGSIPTRIGDKPNPRNIKFNETVIGHGNNPLKDCPR